MTSHLNSKPTAKIAQKLESIYVADSMPVDAKCIWDTVNDFNTVLPAEAKWHGMLVFIIYESKWFIYDKIADILNPLLVNGIIAPGKVQIWKAPGNSNLSILETNDVVEGFIENTFVKGTYQSGDVSLLSSYSIWENTM